jgi:hypothetical protein
LSAINTILNRRIERMMEMCDKAKHVFLIFGETQNYKYIQINEEYFKLDDFEMLNQVCKKLFGSNFSIINMHNNSCASNLLKEIHDKTFQLTLASSRC